MSDAIALTVDKGIGHLRLNRPDRLNALTAEMVDSLAGRCREIERRRDIGVVMLSGAGKAFCAGGDIDAWSQETAQNFARHWVRDGHAAFDALARLRQPLIAVLDGHALGGGLELAACADLRIAEDHIKIGQPETELGIIAGWSGTQRAVRRFGAQAVRRMALMGEVLTASEALALGIVDQVVSPGQGMVAAQEAATRVLARGPVATELTKMLVNAAEAEERERVLEALAGHIAAASADLQAGLSAYRERRPAEFPDQVSASDGKGMP